jgi:hypothetical protein
VTPEENKLAALSKAYLERKAEIDSAVVAQLRRKRPQVLIARDFGLSPWKVHKMAKEAGITYFAPRKKV